MELVLSHCIGNMTRPSKVTLGLQFALAWTLLLFDLLVQEFKNS